MRNFIPINSLFLFLILGMSGCSHQPIIRDEPSIPSATPTPTASPIEDKTPSIVYDPIIPYYKDDTIFIKEGERQANAVLASSCFKDSVLSASFTENNDLTSAQIYAKFVDASPYKVGVKLFYGSYTENRIWHTVGYEGNPIRMNRYFVNSATYVGSTSLHEGFGHGLDFRHDFDHTMGSKSIPYTLNRIFEKCAKQLGFKIEY